MVKQLKMISKLKMQSGPKTRNSKTRDSFANDNYLSPQPQINHDGHPKRNLPAMTKV